MYFRRYDLGGEDSVDATAFAYAEKKKPITNADRIRNMTDEELAQFLEYEVMRWPCCKPEKSANQETDKCTEPDCRGCWLDWMRQEAET